jgi:DNA-binding GntR family transcriptional regulator
MTPKIIAMNRDFTENDPGRSLRTFSEHQEVLDAIEERMPDRAEAAMGRHMDKSKSRRLIR